MFKLVKKVRTFNRPWEGPIIMVEARVIHFWKWFRLSNKVWVVALQNFRFLFSPYVITPPYFYTWSCSHIHKCEYAIPHRNSQFRTKLTFETVEQSWVSSRVEHCHAYTKSILHNLSQGQALISLEP